MEYHLRISGYRDDCISILQKLKETFDIKNMVSCYEYTGMDEFADSMPTPINPHSHSYIEYNKVPTTQKMSNFMKMQPLLRGSFKCVAGYSHKIQKTTKEQQLIYLTKDSDIIYSTLSNEQLEPYKVKSEQINKDKLKTPKEKLLSRWIEKNGNVYPSSKYELFRFIDKIYVREYNKSPLALSHKTSYSTYIIEMLSDTVLKNEDNERLEKSLMCQIYGIRDPEAEYKEFMRKTIEQGKELQQVCKTHKADLLQFQLDLYKKIETKANNLKFVDSDDDLIVSF